MHFRTLVKTIIFIVALCNLSSAQSFGFGCLGFVGGYGGFTYQEYKASGLNEYIRFFNELENTQKPVDEFSYATGYRVGLNLFRATFQSGIILTAKGSFQSLDKSNKGAVGVSQEDENYTLDLDLKNWAIGFDIGWEFTKILSWKILDGSLNINNITLTETTDQPGNSIIKKYKSESGAIGYSVGTGIIVAIIKDYLSIEGTAGYTYLSVENIYDDGGLPFLNPTPASQQNVENNFIESGGFTALIQLNVGFPLL
jgi:hypothetical protein